MNKNKSESVPSKPGSLKTTPSVSVRERSKKTESKATQKPTIDIEIAKGLDTLDREGIKNLKRSLMASKKYEDLHNFVQQEIVCEQNQGEQHGGVRKDRIHHQVDEITEQIIECADEESPSRHKQIDLNGVCEKRVVFQQGKTKTYIKPRPISAIQKQEAPLVRNSQVIKKSFESSSNSSREVPNPFKSQKKKDEHSKITHLLKRIKHLETSQIQQLEIILDKIQKGEIQSVEGSNDIIKMGLSSRVSLSKEKQNVQEKQQQRNLLTTPQDTDPNNKLSEMVETESKLIQKHLDSQVIPTLNSLTLQAQSKQSQHKLESRISKQSLVMPISSFQQMLNKEGKTQLRKNNVFAIKILSNWGHPKIVGLTRIELFSKSGQLIEVQQSQVKNCSKRMLKLFSNTPFTTNQNQMWISPCPEPPAVIVIEIALNIAVGAARIWNYNKSQIQSSKGVKGVKMIMNDEKWSGEIRRGCGSESEDYSTLIKFSLSPNVFIPAAEVPVYQRAPQSASIPLLKQNKSNRWLEQTLVKKQLVQLMEPKKNEKVDNKIQRSGSHQMRKNGSKSTMTNRVESKEEVRYLCHQEPTQARVNLQTEAEAVKKDVAESLQRIRKNLQFQEADIISNLDYKRPTGHPFKANKQISQQKTTQSPPPQKLVCQTERGDKNVKTNYFPQSEKTNPIYPQDCFKIDRENKLSVNQVTLQSKQKKEVSPIVVPNNLVQTQVETLDQLMEQLNSLVPTNKPLRIPQLPKGTKLVFVLLSNWGDSKYIGLSKIEIFDNQGNLIPVGLGQISGNCQQYAISNVINPDFKPGDKSSRWMSQLNRTNKITINLQTATCVSMIRVWNYMESRIHATRGVRSMAIQLDTVRIFQGEISKSTEELSCSNAQYILFTQDSDTIQNIAQKDWVLNEKEDDWEQLKESVPNNVRPTTNEKQKQSEEVSQHKESVNIPNLKRLVNSYNTPVFPKGQQLKILVLSTWGDQHYVGLNRLEIFNDKKSNLLAKPQFKLKANPSSISNDFRTIDKILSVSPANMWLAPLNSQMNKLQGKVNTLSVLFESIHSIGMINFYNYTKTPSRGFREICILLDDAVVYQGFVGNGADKEYTSVAFTKDIEYLKEIGYQGYDEGGMEQQVGLTNQKKKVRGGQQLPYSNMERPFTSFQGTGLQ